MARIGIALGDVTGVGPEVTFKALAALRESRPRTRPKGPSSDVVSGRPTGTDALGPESSESYVIIGDYRICEALADRYGVKIDRVYRGKNSSTKETANPDIPSDFAANAAHVVVYHPTGTEAAESQYPGSATSARCAMSWLEEGARLCLAGKLDGMVTARAPGGTLKWTKT